VRQRRARDRRVAERAQRGQLLPETLAQQETRRMQRLIIAVRRSESTRRPADT